MASLCVSNPDQTEYCSGHCVYLDKAGHIWYIPWLSLKLQELQQSAEHVFEILLAWFAFIDSLQLFWDRQYIDAVGW